MRRLIVVLACLCAAACTQNSINPEKSWVWQPASGVDKQGGWTDEYLTVVRNPSPKRLSIFTVLVGKNDKGAQKILAEARYGDTFYVSEWEDAKQVTSVGNSCSIEDDLKKKVAIVPGLPGEVRLTLNIMSCNRSAP